MNDESIFGFILGAMVGAAVHSIYFTYRFVDELEALETYKWLAN